MHHRWLFHALALLLPITGAGCAIHYTDRRTGVEHLWGLGQFRLRSESIPGGRQQVTFGSTIPGLAIGIGREQFGIAFGLTVRQQLHVSDPHPNVQPSIANNTLHLVLGTSSDGMWGLGHLKMTSISTDDSHDGIITGKAAAGLNAQAGRDAGVMLGASTHQRLSIRSENTYLSFAGTNRHWPYFDLFTLQVSAPDVPNPSANRKDPTQ